MGRHHYTIDSLDRLTLRKAVLARRDALPEEKRLAMSRSIAGLLNTLPGLTQARTVFSYVHFRSEVQTWDLLHYLLDRKQRVCVPLTLKEQSRLLAIAVTDPSSQLVPGYAGILEPSPPHREEVPPASIDAVLVPGAVFDRDGGRLGYGGGFYDRFLMLAAPAALRIGLAYAMQLVDQVPVQAHDAALDYLVTEQAIYYCGRRSHAIDRDLSK